MSTLSHSPLGVELAVRKNRQTNGKRARDRDRSRRAVVFFLAGRAGLGLEMKEKTHASSPSTSGKTHEKTSVIQTRRLQFDA